MNIEYEPRFIGRCAVALGTFDGVHIGHRAVISSAVATGLVPAVVTSDVSAREYFGRGGGRIADRADCYNQFEKLGIATVVQLSFADIRNMSPTDYLTMLTDEMGANHICCGYNFRFGRDADGDVGLITRICQERGIGCTVCDCVSSSVGDVSSSAIRQFLADGDVESAAVMLGRPYSISGRVIDGDKRGRTIGVPTVNQLIAADSAPLRFGVYRSRTVIDGVQYNATTNVGIRPTYKADRPLAETFIIDYSGDLYGRELRIELLEFIRDERRFASLDELEQTLKSDILRCKTERR